MFQYRLTDTLFCNFFSFVFIFSYFTQTKLSIDLHALNVSSISNDFISRLLFVCSTATADNVQIHNEWYSVLYFLLGFYVYLFQSSNIINRMAWSYCVLDTQCFYFRLLSIYSIANAVHIEVHGEWCVSFVFFWYLISAIYIIERYSEAVVSL